jgi:hypothetical protein
LLGFRFDLRWNDTPAIILIATTATGSALAI